MADLRPEDEMIADARVLPVPSFADFAAARARLANDVGPLLADRAELRAEVERHLAAYDRRGVELAEAIANTLKRADERDAEKHRADAAEAREAALREAIRSYADALCREGGQFVSEYERTLTRAISADIAEQIRALAAVPSVPTEHHHPINAHDTRYSWPICGVCRANWPCSDAPTEQPETTICIHGQRAPHELDDGSPAVDNSFCPGPAPAPSGNAVEPDSQRVTWPRHWSSQDQPMAIVAWITKRGGEARYEPADYGKLYPGTPCIVITGPNGPVVMRPGDTATPGGMFRGVRPVSFGCSAVDLREFTVSTPPKDGDQ